MPEPTPDRPAEDGAVRSVSLISRHRSNAVGAGFLKMERMLFKMKKLVIFAFCLLFAGLVPSDAATRVSETIPRPAAVELRTENFRLDRAVGIRCISEGLDNEASYLREQLAENNSADRDGRLRTCRRVELSIDGKIPSEGYVLELHPRKITVRGGSAAGVFYGIQTLLQEMQDGGVLPYGRIEDAPRYAWRGYMLDEARHFSGAARVKLLLDQMARFKMNRFHWHLTDEQGWRIEIKGYPRLATVGGTGCHSNPDTPAQYYTQEEIRDIVAYAAARHIEIIPEIDMPGHASASNRAYPEYSGGGTEQHPDFTFNVGKEETYAFLTDVLREISALFPSEWLHLGGDEVAYGSDAWKRDPHVQALMAREGLTTVKQAERYFMRRMADSVRMLGKTLVGWDELLDLGLDPQRSLIMWWRHDKPDCLRRSLDGAYTTILCPRKPLYFDFVQHADHKWGRIWDGFCPLEDVYAFPDAWFEGWGMTSEWSAHILGIQANVWSELMHTAERVDFMTFPRLCALSEAVWSQPDVKDYGDFMRRMEAVFASFDRLGIYYFDPRNPGHHPEPAGPEIIKRQPPKMDFRD